MTLRDSVPVVLVRSSCSCAAGQEICNHIVALLYQAAHYSEKRMSVVPPVLSCTDTEQKWHKPRTMGVKPGPVDAMVVIKAKQGHNSASGIRSTLYKAYNGELPVPSTLNHQTHYSGLDPESLPLICHMNISAEKNTCGLSLWQSTSWKHTFLPSSSTISQWSNCSPGCSSISKTASRRLPPEANCLATCAYKPGTASSDIAERNLAPVPSY